ncbi:MAG: SNF2-related protein [Sphaerochaeta sp.]|jgi:superfamily II DNA or RNA helicase|uniref:DEAD/DEAH box helicase n=1 Tax=Sphaerochaeta sp. TaxID=1972642 RepID=UPI002A3603F4|nr:SNF2-related protein [Sphaerochaeta sp.]MDX9825038.1 SNF2-related protein [Sphaerochaeta sp.]
MESTTGKRGRPKKDTTVVAVQGEAKPTGRFFFHLIDKKDGWGLQLLDSKGNTCEPDYHRYTGCIRNALREFFLMYQKEQKYLRWDALSELETGFLVHDPGPRLIELALRSQLLLDENHHILQPSNEESSIQLVLESPQAHLVTAYPSIRTADQTVLNKGTSIHPISCEHVVLGTQVFHCEDLGPYWNEWNILNASLKASDLETYLSLILSKFPTITLAYEGYSIHNTHPVHANPSLYFKEIDAYGYLHILPLIHLQSYPPGFFEEQDIIKVVQIDEAEKRLSISEVVYPEDPAEDFRALLAKMGKEAKTSVFEEEGHFILESDFAQRFLSLSMGELIARFTLFQAAILSKFKFKFAQPKLRLSLGSGIDYFEGDAEISLENETFSFTRFLSEYQKNGFIMLNDGSRVYPDMKKLRRFERLVHQQSKQKETVQVSFFDLPALEKEAELHIKGDGADRMQAFYQGFNTLSEKPATYELAEGTLRPYQTYGVQWMEYLQQYHMGACLADEMGLGKTVQVIALLRNLYKKGNQAPTLILVPRSLIFNWQSELSRFAPELSCTLYYGNARQVSQLEDPQVQIILSSYATIRNDAKELAKMRFCYIILDESQTIKNLETKTTNAVLALRAEHRLALSGTPVENGLSELYSLFQFLNPLFFSSQKEYLQTYLKPIQENQDPDALKDLKTRLYPFMLRRVKKDVLKDLPEKTEQTAYIELEPQHLAIYHKRREELKQKVSGAVSQGGIAKNTFMILQALTELRRLASVPEADGGYPGISAKRSYCKDVVSSLVNDGHKCLIFTNFLATIELISEDLSSIGIEHLVMTGATVDRQSLVQRFQSDPSIGAFVMTLKTGGLGLNLTAADYVFIVDPWWNRAAENQAIDRTHRIGQTNPVFCYRMIAKDTIEEKILELQQRKADLASSLLASDSNAVKALSEEDIEQLLG